MRILTLHCDYIRFKANKKALKDAPELSEEDKKEKEVKECLVVLTSIEQGDNKDTVKQLIEAVVKTAGEVKTNNVVLYPYAHLSSNLARPPVAMELLDEAESLLKKKFKMTRAPFGYYKEFEFKCKGHPLAELSKEFKPTADSKPESPKMKLEEVEQDTKKLLNEISKTKLDTSKLRDNDHRILGQKLDLFMFNESSPGMPYWLPNGFIIFNELVKFWREEHNKMGYKETATPLINKSSLYKVSGHWNLYKDNMFVSEIDNESYGVKPMNCPNAMIIFKSKSVSYKDLPLRLSDTDRLHRYELSGTLNGLLRVRTFQQDDSHNFISEDMIKSEYEHIFKVCEKFYKIFNMEYSFKLGTRPEKFLGDKKTWDKAELILKDVLKESKVKYSINEGDGAFYGPKIDIYMKDSLGREWQMGTIQLDYQLPKRFELTYTDKDGKEKTPIVVHRVIYGSLERFIGVLLEHTNGNLPLWLSPRQVRVISFTDRNNKATEKFAEELKEALSGIRIDTDTRSDTVQSKIRDAEMLKINYTIVIGDKEEKSKTLAVRPRGGKPQFGVKVSKFIEDLKKELNTHQS